MVGLPWAVAAVVPKYRDYLRLHLYTSAYNYTSIYLDLHIPVLLLTHTPTTCLYFGFCFYFHLIERMRAHKPLFVRNLVNHLHSHCCTTIPLIFTASCLYLSPSFASLLLHCVALIFCAYAYLMRIPVPVPLKVI